MCIMENKKWQYLLEIVNDEIKPFDVEIFVKENGISYDIQIDDRLDFLFRVDYVQDVNEESLLHEITELWERIKNNLRERFGEFIGFRKIHGDNHGDPALVWSLTDVDLFYKLPNGNFEKVDDINDYEDHEGEFYVRSFDYGQAFWIITLHDVFGEECD